MKLLRKKTLKVRLVLKKDNKILLLRQMTNNRVKHTLPGGKVEHLEALKEALIRECKEEINIRLKESNLAIVHTLQKIKPKEDRLTFYFEAKEWEGYLKCLETEKFKGLDWVDLNDLPKTTSGTVVHVLQEINNQKQYSYYHIGSKTMHKKARLSIRKNKEKGTSELSKVLAI